MRKILLLCFFLLLVAPFLRAAEVSIIYGEDSLWDKKEVAFAERRANGMKRHLARVGFNVAVYSDKDYKNALSKDCKTASLLLCHNPNKEFISELQKFVSRGGRLSIFYSGSPALAQLMGVSVEKFVAPPKKTDKWERLVFTWPRPIHMPEVYAHELPRVLQLIPGKESKVIGSWVSTSGEKGPVGLIETPYGFWVSFLPSEYANPKDYTFFVASMSYHAYSNP